MCCGCKVEIRVSHTKNNIPNTDSCNCWLLICGKVPSLSQITLFSGKESSSGSVSAVTYSDSNCL